MDISQLDPDRDRETQILSEDGGRVLSRVRRNLDGISSAVLAVLSDADPPTPASLERLAHEHELRDELDPAWAVRPLALEQAGGRTTLLFEDPGGEPLEALIGAPMQVDHFLRLAVGITSALGKAHQRGLVHKDVKPSNILVNLATGEVRLTGFGIASRLPRERPAADAIEFVSGSLAYMAPEQTGRMNRSVDTRSDLYAVGVVLYEMLTGALPFNASDPMEWVHCHIARAPTPPWQRVPQAPAAISAIILKCLAKTAEDRYQTAGGLLADLKLCQDEWESHGSIAPSFTLGAHDVPDTLRIPEKLYGREAEVGRLMEAFDRVVAHGSPELVLVSGYSGVGKSSVVNELHKALVPTRGLFAAGKFDQYKRHIPYPTLAQAFQGLVRELLGKSEAELARWRDDLRAALEPNAALIITLVPDLKLILGEPPPVAELPPQDSEQRFRQAIRRFVGVFARPEHPLALFLDDLQWLDAATLGLLVELATHPDMGWLLLVGAYRDNEVDATHPLRPSLKAIRDAGGAVTEIVLSPLPRAEVLRLLADALHCPLEAAVSLADLVFEKTAGNPFFTIQFLTALAEERLLVFSRAGRWVWNLKRIRAKGYTDNVVDLMVDKIARLPPLAREALQWLAALGDKSDFTTLRLVLETDLESIHAALWEPTRAGLVLRQADAYGFLHDRIQEAAYSLIPAASRAERHLRIGRILSHRLPAEQVARRIFEVVNQLDRGLALVEDPQERDSIAELNLRAGLRAKVATAYDAALRYFVAGSEALADDRWSRRYGLAFALELNRAECEFLTGDMEAAAHRLAQLCGLAADTVDLAAVTCRRSLLYTTMDRSDLAVEACLEYLRKVGIDLPRHPTPEDVGKEFEALWQRLGDRPIESLIDLPRMADPERIATLEVIFLTEGAALFTELTLYALFAVRSANLSLEYGVGDSSPATFVVLGILIGSSFDDYETGFKFGKLGLDLVEKRGFFKSGADVYTLFGAFVVPWTKHIREGVGLLRRGFTLAQQAGNLVFMGYGACCLIGNRLTAGDPLAEVQEEAERARAVMQRANCGLLIVGGMVGPLQLARMLRGLTASFGSFDDADFDDAQFEAQLEGAPPLRITLFWYLVRKLQARILSGDFIGATAVAAKAGPLVWTSPGMFEVAEYVYYAALGFAGCCAEAPAEARGASMEPLRALHAKLIVWEANCPANFADRVALVAAEIAGLEGRELEAIRLYDEAIRAAHAGGFVQNEALANETAGRFYLRRGTQTTGLAHLRNARDGYALWGAEGKVRQLEALYPQLAAHPSALAGAAAERIDTANLVKASQAVFGEIALPRLIETLMTITLQNAGADRGLLLLPQEDSLIVEAEARADAAGVQVTLQHRPMTGEDAPKAVVNTVIRTRESLLLEDGARPGPIWEAALLGRATPRSAFCLPLLRQGRLGGVLYLENSQAAHAFTAKRVAVLEVVAAQAAIALENARLYADLAEREARIRRLVDANIVGVVVWDPEGQLIEANEAFLKIVGYGREDLASGRLRWQDLTPPEWLTVHETRWGPTFIASGSLAPFEQECLRKDGSRAPVLVGSAAFEQGRSDGVAFVLDLTDLKRAQAQAHEREQLLRNVQAELAHANRVATTGHLAGSIAHDVNQPVAAAMTNAAAGVRWLSADPPDIGEAKLSLASIIESCRRAGEIIAGMRALVKKDTARIGPVALNEAVAEIVALTRNEAERNTVEVRTRLAEDLPPIEGDRVQLQQVILNLVINAVQAMSDVDGPRELLITTEATKDGVVAAVEDSGPGFSVEQEKHLFDAFYTTKASGLGLGLAICRSIADAHGGRLSARAKTPRGAHFEFVLPTTPTAHSQAPAASSRFDVA
jgi:PAS domain S-box-containing protein